MRVEGIGILGGITFERPTQTVVGITVVWDLGTTFCVIQIKL